VWNCAFSTPSMGAHTPSMGAHTPSIGAHTSSMGAHTSSMGAHTSSMGAHTPSMGTHTPIAVVGRLPSGVAHDGYNNGAGGEGGGAGGSASDRSARHTEPGNWRVRYYLDSLDSDVQQLGCGGGCEDAACGGGGESEDELLAPTHGIALSGSLPDVLGPVEPDAFAAGDRGGILPAAGGRETRRELHELQLQLPWLFVENCR
jgi:hypothetical protein